jgi:hypothetical protein
MFFPFIKIIDKFFHYFFSETMESNASEIPSKALKKKWKESNAQMMPPPIGIDILYIIYTPLDIVRLDCPSKFQ